MATASGVPPDLAISSAIAWISRATSGSTAERTRLHAAGRRSHRAVPRRHAQDRVDRALADRRRRRQSTPLMRVWAVKGTNWALSCAMSRPRMPYFSLASTTIERPSGVSSASEASCAASASSCSVTPRTGRNSVAWRLPSVIVPVLSSSSVSTSPAASTARPDIASTLKRTSRSMPAMPIADSSAPMVVGISVTNSATSTTTEIEPPA